MNLHRCLLLLLPVWATLCSAPPALANDRPFMSARTAVVEDDNEGTWSMEFWLQRFGRVRGVSIEPEYSFTTRTSMQVELTKLHDRDGAETGHEAEVEFKHLFNDIARDGWGMGVSAALGTEHARAEGTRRTLTLKLPVSLALGETGALLHVNGGVVKPGDARRHFTTSAALEFDAWRRTRGFVEVARDGEARFAQVGARHWLRKERLALDLSLQQHRGPGERASGFILGLGWYDL
jgi:hypothetical protein